MLSMDHSGRYFYHADDLGSIRKVTDTNGNVVEQYRYSDYGAPSFFDGSGAPLAGTQITNNTLYTGRRFDTETSLYYYRTRYLDPNAGRFITRDSIGIWGDSTALGNGFTYCGNSPVSPGPGEDPSGMVRSYNTSKSNTAISYRLIETLLRAGAGKAGDPTGKARSYTDSHSNTAISYRLIETLLLPGETGLVGAPYSQAKSNHANNLLPDLVGTALESDDAQNTADGAAQGQSTE
jgi:RHS repeat-associated protein